MKPIKYSFSQSINFIIAEHIADSKLNGAFIANRIGMSRMTLYRRLKQRFGLSARDYILQYRLRIAKDLLSNSSQTIGTIAKNLGFKDASYFTKVFKKQFGILPSDYRKKNRTYTN